MLTALLETKLFVPGPRRRRVVRPRLSELLDRGTASKLVLVSAPAGFGKSMLLADWVAAGPGAAGDERSVAWLSLDASDNDPVTFWSYVLAALGTVEPGLGENELALLRAAQPPPIEAVLTTLLNDLGALPGEVVLVLDDYHVIDSREVHDAMAFLLDHLPARVHLVIAGRADPSLPLARWRGRGELVEIRAADLRFRTDEATAYLNDVMGLVLTSQDVAALAERTEGWIVALQLAALSLQGRDDAAGFIAGFAGDDRYVVDYLVEEVLQRQPEHIESFLLQTCVLTRLSGPLCEAVTGQGGGKATLDVLDRGNLFLVPLDGRRQWYRYHHLFADVLRTRLLDEQPQRVSELHRRASDWYEQNGERSEAIRHALAGEHVARAAELVELAVPALRRERQEAQLLRWLQALPDDVVRVRPVLSVAYAGALMSTGRFEGIEARLRDAERWLEPTTSASSQSTGRTTAMVVVDEQELRRLPSELALYRSAQALVLGDVVGTMTYARRSLELVAAADDLGRGSPSALLGLAYWTSGDLAQGQRWYAEAMSSLERAGHLSDVLGCALALADIRIAQGRLREAMGVYERGLQLATEQVGPVLRGAADMHVGMAELLRERDDLEGARQHLLASSALGEHVGLLQNPYRWHVTMAGVRGAEGDLDGALELLDEADRLYVGDFSPQVRPVPSLRSRVLVARGEWRAVLRWAGERPLSVDDDLSYLRECEHITLARALLAGHAAEPAGRHLDDALGLLARLLTAAEEGERTGSVIELLVLQAVAHQLRGDVTAALAPLQRAVSLAEPEGYLRVFADEGPQLVPLLRALAKRGAASGLVRRLLAGVERTAGGQHVDQSRVDQSLVDPLSARELDVLRLLATDLAGPEIARELVVSLNTVRTHTKNIYAKLAVSNRRAAVRRAAELNLLLRNRSS